MSILLEALRKSEQRQRRGAVPGLTTAEPEILFADAASSAWRPALWTAAGLVLVLLVVVLSLGGWRGWFDPQVSEPPSGSSPAGAAGDQAASRMAAESGSSAGDQPGNQTVDHSSPREDSRSDGRTGRSPGANIAETMLRRSAPRSPVETLPVTSAERVNENAVPARPAAGEAPASRSVIDETPAQTDDPSPLQPGVISYWQLPESVRETLPALRITVLVYAEQPEDRFLLMDGRRWTEGDELGGGLRLQEIRRDGAVLSYRLYRFLREQG